MSNVGSEIFCAQQFNFSHQKEKEKLGDSAYNRSGNFKRNFFFYIRHKTPALKKTFNECNGDYGRSGSSLIGNQFFLLLPFRVSLSLPSYLELSCIRWKTIFPSSRRELPIDLLSNYRFRQTNNRTEIFHFL